MGCSAGSQTYVGGVHAATANGPLYDLAWPPFPSTPIVDDGAAEQVFQAKALPSSVSVSTMTAFLGVVSLWGVVMVKLATIGGSLGENSIPACRMRRR
jgi:hypothetical protein